MDGPTTFYMLSRALVLRRYILVVMGATVVAFLVAMAVTHGHADAAAPWIIGSGFAVSIVLAIVPTRVDLDPSAAPVDRAAAAVAIAGDGDPRSRERLGAVAEATVAPRLRVVIEEFARGEDEAALEAALAGMTEEEPPRRA
jgi:hypothetical protein